MITYSIKAKSLVTKLSDVIGNRSRIVQQPPQQQGWWRLNKKKIEEEYTNDRIPWPKLKFNLWIEDIKKEYKIDDLVTLRQTPPISNAIPHYWTVSYINELFHDCRFDTDIQQPIALTVRSRENVMLHKCPATLRKLTKEELELVNLSNKKPEGSA